MTNKTEHYWPDGRIVAAVKAWDHHWGERYGDEAVEEMSEEVTVALAAADAHDRDQGIYRVRVESNMNRDKLVQVIESAGGFMFGETFYDPAEVAEALLDAGYRKVEGVADE